MPATYEPIATQTLSSTAATVTFSSIPSTYTDLILIFSGTNPSGNRAGYMRFNGDTGTNYSYTFFQADGTTIANSRTSNSAQLYFGNVMTDSTNAIIQIMNYSNATTYKTFLSRCNIPSTVIQAIVGLWRSTAAINSISLSLNADSYGTGCTFTLYGIKAA